MKRVLSLVLSVIMLLSLMGGPVFAEEDGIIFTPTADNCEEFSGWTGSSSLKRHDEQTMAPLGGGIAKFEVPQALDGLFTLYYWVPKYASGYTEGINCATKVEVTTADGSTRSLSINIIQGNGGEWVSLGNCAFSGSQAEYINVTGSGSGQNRLTDIKFVECEHSAYTVLPQNFLSTAGDWSCITFSNYGAFQDKVLVSDDTQKNNAITTAKEIIPGDYYVYVHSFDSNYSTGTRKFNLKINGKSYYKSGYNFGLFETKKYFGTHFSGTEFENTSQDPATARISGAWEKMTYPSDKITVGSDGILKIEAVSQGLTARFDAILITQDPDFDMSLSVSDGVSLGTSFPAEIFYSDDVPFPAEYSVPMKTVENTATLSNSHTTISFQKGILESGKSAVQRKVESNGVTTVPFENGLGFMSMFATKATGYQEGGYYATYYTEFPSPDNSTTIKTDTQNVFRAGIPEWIIPDTLEQVDTNTVRMTSEGTYASLTATWTLEEGDLEPKVTVTATAKKKGELSFGFFNEVQEVDTSRVGYIVNPYRWQERRFSDPGIGITETNSTTDHTQMTYKIDENGREITLGVAVDRSSIDLTVDIEGSEYDAGRWPHDMLEKTVDKKWLEDKNDNGSYKTAHLDYHEQNADFVMTTIGNEGGVLPAVFAPKLSSADSSFDVGDTFTFSYRPLSIVSTSGENRGWYDAYKHVAQDLRGVYDYRDNYYASMTDTAFNILNFLKDDEASGWDTNMVGHYNVEDSNWTSNSNGLVYLQNYLLTEDQELLMSRTLPSMGAILTRDSSHLHSAFSIENVSEGPINKELEYTSIQMGNATFEGAYLLTRGQMPVYRKIAKNRYMGTDVESANLGLKNTTDYYWYERANGSTNYPLTIANADEYLQKRSFFSATNIPDIGSFINISYSPQFQAQLDAYEITGDKKYLEGAVEGARRFLPSLRITDMPENKSILYVENTEQLVAEDKMHHSRSWSIANRSYHRGAIMEATGNTEINGSPYTEYKIRGYDENYMNVRDMTGAYPAWVTARTGLGVEQFTTCYEGRNILLSSWAGDVLRLGYLSGDELMMDLARSALVGRFSNYPGYNIGNYTRLYSQPNYPTDSFDMTTLYFHHAPVLLSAVQDYLFSNAYVKSDGKVDFPNTRIQGYAWFNNRIYGHEAGVIYDETGMWPWLKEGTITVSSKQIDWIAGRNEGRAAFVLTNASDNTENVTVTFNSELGIINDSQATVYDKTGISTTATIKNNSLTLTIPAKGIMTVAVSGSGIHLPKYAKIKFDETEQNDLDNTALGLMYEGNTYTPSYTLNNGTFSSNYSPETGYDVKAYALAIDPENYMGYIFIGGRSTEQYKLLNGNYGGGDGDAGIIKTTLKWHFEGDNKVTTVEDSEFPFEFFIPVTDRTKKIMFNVETEFKTGVKTLDKEYTIAPASLEMEDMAKYTFEPVSMSIIKALGSVTAPLTKGRSKYCIDNSNISQIPIDVTVPDALTGCYLNGYLKVKDLYTTPELVEKGYVLFDNVPIVNSAINTNSNNRLDFSVYDIRLDSAATHEYDENGIYIGEKQGIVGCPISAPLVYEWDNLYITNAGPKKGFNILKNGNSYTLTTDGAMSCFVVIATYDGDRLVNSAAEQVIVSINNSKSYTLSGNQRLFVWENDVNRGTTMKPIYASSLSDVFDPVQIVYLGQGSATGVFRFVIDPASLPFEANEQNLVGLPVYGYVVAPNGERTLLDTVISGYEPRSENECVIILPVTSSVSLNRGVHAGDTWALMIFPYGTSETVKAEKTKDLKGLGLNSK